MPHTEIKIQDGLLTVRQTDEAARVRLALHGELDLSNAPTAEVQLEAALRTSKDVLIDLSRLEFLDSTGIALLVAALQRRDAARLSFLPSEAIAVRRLLSLTGLDAKLPLAEAEPVEPVQPAKPAATPAPLLPAA